MTARNQNQNSGSDEDPQVMDQRKQRRMLSNRESARRSRMRKQKHLDDLINQATQLKAENSQIMTRVNIATQHYAAIESENTILRTQVMELTERLQSLNSVLHLMEEVSGMAMDIPEIPDPLLRPWQLPCPSQPIMNFQCWSWKYTTLAFGEKAILCFIFPFFCIFFVFLFFFKFNFLPILGTMGAVYFRLSGVEMWC